MLVNEIEVAEPEALVARLVQAMTTSGSASTPIPSDIPSAASGCRAVLTAGPAGLCLAARLSRRRGGMTQVTAATGSRRNRSYEMGACSDAWFGRGSHHGHVSDANPNRAMDAAAQSVVAEQECPG